MCNIVAENGQVNFDASCKCHIAVLRAYATLVSVGTPQCRALEAAKIVYAHHHPEDARETASLTVERWINAARLH